MDEQPSEESSVGPGELALREQASDKLTALVRIGLLQPGDPLPGESDLGATLGVARETIRGVLQTLAARGMVDMAPGARSRIADSAHWRAPGPPRHDLAPGLDQYTPEEVYESRRLIETMVAREAALRISPNLLNRLQRLVIAQGGMFDDSVAFLMSDVEFHLTIYRAGGNRLLAAFLSGVYEYALTLRRRAMLAPGAVRRSWEDHKLILAALEARDGEAAAIAMGRHLLRVHETTVAAMERPDP